MGDRLAAALLAFAVAATLSSAACRTERGAAAGGDAVASGGGPAAATTTDDGAAPALVLVHAVAPVTLADRVRFSGTIAPRRQTLISPEVPGPIRAITKRAGDPITKGEVLVRLDRSDFELAVRQAKARLAVARAAVEQAREGQRSAALPLERVRQLRQTKAVPAARFDEVESAWKMAGRALATARAQRDLAEVGLAHAEQQLEDTVITAPYDGYVVQRLVDEGEVARPMPPTVVLAVVEVPPYYVEGAVNEIEAVRLAPGATLAVRLDALPDAAVVAVVTHVNQMVDPATRAVTVRAEIRDGAAPLKVGMSAEVVADMGQRTALFVPRVAFVEREGDRALVHVVEGGRATRRPIRLGDVHRDGFLVEEGLRAGERVVVAGQGAIGPDGAVRVKEEARRPPAAPTVAGERSAGAAGAAEDGAR